MVIGLIIRTNGSNGPAHRRLLDKSRIHRDFVGKRIRIFYRAVRVLIGSLNSYPRY